MYALALTLWNHECDFMPVIPIKFPSIYKLTSGWARGGSPAQSNGDRIAIRLRFRALSAEMAAPPAAVERDALARCGIFTGLFACLFVRHLLRRRAQVYFARARVACTVLGHTRPPEFRSCGCYEGDNNRAMERIA